MWSFATPLAFLLLPLPWLALLWLKPQAAGHGSLAVPQALAAELSRGGGGTGRSVPALLLPALLWIGLVSALAGPRQLVDAVALPASGRDIILALDLSGSMEQMDFDLDGKPARRVDVVKRVAADFVRGRAGDRIGLVIFAEKAYFATPPTFDVEAVARSIAEASIGISGKSTAISDGLGLAMKRLQDSASPARVVILLSDGMNTSGSVKPAGAAALAARLGIRVHTVALGVHDLATAEDGTDAVDAAMLQSIARTSGGTAFRVRSTADMLAVSRSIDAMEASPTEAPASRIHRDLWIYPGLLSLLAALLLLAARRRAA